MVKVFGAKCIGIDALRVMVEITIEPGIGVHMVGLCDTAVKESLLRTITALQSIGFRIPGKKIVLNLAPADLHKNGSGYDLPIAIGILAGSGQIEGSRHERFMIMGELGLDGSVRDIQGALPIAELAIKEGFKGLILPINSALECIDMHETEIYGVKTLEEVIEIISGSEKASSYLIWNSTEYSSEIKESNVSDYMDFSEVIGQESAKRGIEIAAAGGHNVIMVGSPGSGKSSLAKAMAGILPPMSHEESVSTSKIYSVAGKGSLRRGLMRQRPFRSPHYSASLAAIIGGGGGDYILPGEISLAQNGVLFLDEFSLMPKSVIEALRAPLEERNITISRLRGKVKFPASFMLVAAANPCPCGYFGEGERCTCTPVQRLNHLSRLSGPILDRIDIQLRITSIPASLLVNAKKSRSQRETSASVAERVGRAREIQKLRFGSEPIYTNAEMNSRQIGSFCPLSEECNTTIQKIIEKMELSARAFSRIIKLARTIADLESASDPLLWTAGGRLKKDAAIHPIRPEHLLEAASFRFLDRQKQ